MVISSGQLFFPGDFEYLRKGTQLKFVQIEGEQMNFERATSIGPGRSWLSDVRRLFIGALGVFLFLMQTSVARGQRLDGSLRVEVGDSSGGSILDAKVTGTNEGTNGSVSSNGSSAGTYGFPNLLGGTYPV